MPLGTNVSAGLDRVPTPPSTTVVTTELKSKWATIIDQGGLETQDSGTLVNPDAQITNSTTHIFVTGGRGTKLLLRIKYDDGITLGTDPLLRVFGRHSSGDTHWMLLYNDNSAPNSVIVIIEATPDVTDGTDQWTDVGGTAGEVTLATLGCDEFIVGVQTAAIASSGDATLMTLEAKVF